MRGNALGKGPGICKNKKPFQTRDMSVKSFVCERFFVQYQILNHPIVFAIELMRIKIKNTGVIHLIITVKSFSPENFPFVMRTSSATLFGLMMKPTKIAVKRATIGISTLLLTKSIISRIVIFAQEINESGPNPREDGAPRAILMIVTKMQELFRLQWNLS